MATLVAGGQGPALVRFINTTSDVEGSKDKALRGAVQDSKNLADLFKPTNEDVCMAARHFRLFCVCTGEIDPKGHPAVNRLTPPAVVLIDAGGQTAKVLAGSVKSSELMAAMAQVLKAQVAMDKLLTVERRILKDVLELDNLRTNLDSKKKALDTAKGPQVQKMESEIKAMEAKVEEIQARIQAMESTLPPAG